MNPSYLLIALLALSGCDSPSSSASGATPSPIELPDGTLAIDSGQEGSFEITILPLDLDASWEPNQQATKESTIELEIDGMIRVAIPRNDVLRITGLSKRRLSVVEFVDGERASSFFVDGRTKPRMVADYYEIYGNWIVLTAIPAIAKEQSASEYVIGMLKTEKESGVVTKNAGELFWPTILESEPTAVIPWHGNTVLLDIELPTDSAMRFLAVNGFKRDRTMENIAKDIPLLDKLFSRGEEIPMYSASFVIPRIGMVEMTSYVDLAGAERTKISLQITQHTLHFVLQDTTSAEQAGTGQPATSPESKSEGSDKPQPEAEGRSR